jgi:lysophospholipase
MAQRGIACHAIDLRGQGRAKGRRGFVRKWSDYLEDLKTLLNRVAAEATGAQQTLVLGHSHGGLIVAAAGLEPDQYLPGVRGCILTSPFLRSRLSVPRWKQGVARVANPILPWMQFGTGLEEELMSSDPAMIRESRADPYRGRVATPRWFLGMRKAQERVMNGANQFLLPLLVLAGGQDQIADMEGAKLFFERAGSTDKRFEVYPTMRHELLREAQRETVFRDILQWIVARSVVSRGDSRHSSNMGKV